MKNKLLYLIRLSWFQKKIVIRYSLLLIIIMMIQKIFGISYMTDFMTVSAMGFISILIGLNMRGKKE